MPVKSLDELKIIRESQLKKVKLRESGDVEGNNVEVMVGMATCGIAAGSRETLNEFVKEINARNLENIKVIQVGCMGYCHSEPTVQVNKPGSMPLIFGNVDTKSVNDIIKYILTGEIPDEKLLIKTFENAR